tara:strand:+ start:19 stop:147 length:129 start_codon:yes stop_codon:yes gene_type:complete
MKNLTEKKMENDIYTYLQLPDDYWTITTTMDIDVQYEEDESN